jgi:AcrR family transcriptional regulator
MPVPARLLRVRTDDLPQPRRFLNDRERERRALILAAGREVMAVHGRHAITLSQLAIALRMAPASFRRHFTDIDDLLGTILRDHLMEVARALGRVPQDAPDRRAAQRAAYLHATRTAFNAPTEAHLLLIRDRHALPPDEFDSVEKLRLGIGDILAGAHAVEALTLLDTPECRLPQIEAALAGIRAATLAEAHALRAAAALPDAAATATATAAAAAPPDAAATAATASAATVSATAAAARPALPGDAAPQPPPPKHRPLKHRPLKHRPLKHRPPKHPTTKHPPPKPPPSGAMPARVMRLPRRREPFLPHAPSPAEPRPAAQMPPRAPAYAARAGPG